MSAKSRLRLVTLLLLALFIGLGSLPETAQGDTYNFHFTKPKKKTKKSVTVTPQGTAPQAEEVEKVEVPEEEDATEEEAAPEPKKDKRSIKSGDDRAIVIHNHNYIGDVGKTAAPVAAPVATPAEPVASSKAEIAAPRSNYNDSRFRFGIAASYFPKKSIRSHDWMMFSSTEENHKAYGGTVGFGWVPSNLFTMNLYLGGSHAEKRDQTMYLLGFDGEFYPFANPSATELSGMELGVLLGATTHFATDGNLLALHAGGRLNLNLTGKMGLTAVARVSESYVMFETGIITRF